MTIQIDNLNDFSHMADTDVREYTTLMFEEMGILSRIADLEFTIAHVADDTEAEDMIADRRRAIDKLRFVRRRMLELRLTTISS